MPARLDGTLAEGHVPALDDRDVLAAWRAMLLSRAFDERCFSLPAPRPLGHLLDRSRAGGRRRRIGLGTRSRPRLGRPPVPRAAGDAASGLHARPHFFLYFRGNPAGNEMPEGVNVLPIQISLAAAAPARGRTRLGPATPGTRRVVIAYFGDGASSEGDVHEAMNLAGVRRAPVIFLLQNNGWAISTPVSKQTAAQSFAARAAGYGFPGELGRRQRPLRRPRRDAQSGRPRAAGAGPTLIESRTYRMGAHNTADDPTRYVDPDGARSAAALLTRSTRLRSYLHAHAACRRGRRSGWRASSSRDRRRRVSDAEARGDARARAALRPRLRRAAGAGAEQRGRGRRGARTRWRP